MCQTYRPMNSNNNNIQNLQHCPLGNWNSQLDGFDLEAASSAIIPTQFTNIDNWNSAAAAGSTESDGFGLLDAASSTIPTQFMNVDSLLPQKQQAMPLGYKPTATDVCCGRGKQHWQHAGNVNFRKFIKNNVHLYQKALSKTAKTAVVVSLLAEVRSLGGHFLKFEDQAYGINDGKPEYAGSAGGCWVDIGDMLAREKVSHSLRDQINHQARQKAKMVQKQQHVKSQQLQWQQEQQRKLRARQSSSSLIPGIPEFPSSGLPNINNNLRHPGAVVLPRFTQQQACSMEVTTGTPKFPPSGLTNINNFEHPSAVALRGEFARHQQQAQSFEAMMVHQPLLPSAATTSAATRKASIRAHGDDHEDATFDPGRAGMDRHSPSFVPTGESNPVSIFDI